ncbi:MAG: efflux RND transporter periplasmic adaptor subunit [Pseudomonadota bacterium]
MKAFNLLAFFFMAFSVGSVMAQQGPTPVFVANVQKVSFVDEVEALGTLQANENVNLLSNVTERITVINFEDNQRVQKGDILVEMDAAEEEAELVEEESRRNEALRQVKRLKPLVERGAASKSALDEQQRELNASRARIKAIQSRLNERKIKAPFDGVVGIRNISVGAMARPETIITTIDDDSVMKLDFSVPEIFLSSLQKDIDVNAKTSAYPDRIFTGSISSIDSRVNPNTRSVAARAILPNEDKTLKAGMLMRVQLNKNPRQSLVIPEEAIISTGSENAVMVIEKGEQITVRRQVIEIGARREGDVEVLKGLNEGQQVVTHGTLRVRPGGAVTIQAVEKNDESLTELLNQNKPDSDEAS